VAGTSGSYHGVMDLRALVVSPDQESTNLLTLILSELGVATEITASIQGGLKLLEQQRFDAIVLDYRVGEECASFLQHLRQCPKSSIGILIVIVDSDFNPRPLFGLGANFILYRPLSSERTRISLRAARPLMRRERRRAPRIPVAATVKVAYPGAPELNATLQDLSADGTSLKTPEPLPAECKVYFEFSLPQQAELIRLSGEVAWQDARGRSGIRFIDVPQSSRRLIQAWLQQKKNQMSAASAQPGKRESGPTTGLVSNAGNRRDGRRLDCKLGAEVYRLGGNVPHRCALSDISEGGCYVEMPTPLAVQSSIEIVVRTADTKVRIAGQVLNNHPGFGMGVRFIFDDDAEREDILRLLAVLASGPTLDELPR